MKGKVYLIGAGPGDPELISVKGLRFLKKADVVIYDNLINKKLLKEVKENAELIYVGKSSGEHTLPQESINKLMEEKSKEKEIVVRLKGGDPFVFGRGGEEALYLAEKGIPFEVVPGITAAVAVPAYAGIPVSHRVFNTTIGLITGHEDSSKKGSRLNWEKISSAYETLIFYMGMKNIEKIVQNLLRYGKSPETPVAIIRLGTLPSQKTIMGNLKNIVKLAKKNNFEPPAIIVIGEIVKLREKLNWYESKLLFGKKIIITRSREQTSKLAELLEDLGAETIEIPTIKILPPRNLKPLDNAMKRIKTFNWIVFTSINSFKFFIERFLKIKKDLRELYGIKIAAIGTATKEFIESFNLKVDFYPSEFTSEIFLKEFKKKEKIIGKKILLPRADIARDLIENELKKEGAEVESIVAYRTERELNIPEEVREYINKEKIDFITFTSSSTVKNFFSLKLKIDGAKIASIGPVTSHTLKELGYTPDVEAKIHIIPGLVESILNYYKKENK
ncbi:MAG: uroporphyrinogen-III C-methyltransferase [Acidobacteriota bacterium]